MILNLKLTDYAQLVAQQHGKIPAISHVQPEKKCSFLQKSPKQGKISRLIVSHESTRAITTFNPKERKELCKWLDISLAYRCKAFRLPESSWQNYGKLLGWGYCSAIMQKVGGGSECTHMGKVIQIKQWFISSQTLSIVGKLCLTTLLQTARGPFSSTSAKNSKDSGIQLLEV